MIMPNGTHAATVIALVPTTQETRSGPRPPNAARYTPALKPTSTTTRNIQPSHARHHEIWLRPAVSHAPVAIDTAPRLTPRLIIACRVSSPIIAAYPSARAAATQSRCQRPVRHPSPHSSKSPNNDLPRLPTNGSPAAHSAWLSSQLVSTHYSFAEVLRIHPRSPRRPEPEPIPRPFRTPEIQNAR